MQYSHAKKKNYFYDQKYVWSLNNPERVKLLKKKKKNSPQSL